VWKGCAVPERRSSIAQPVGQSRMGISGRWFMNEISRSNVFSLLSASQRLLERLEAENARLRCRVAELMLEIQALREALGHPESEIRPK
jgi:hypothetical protein